MTSDEIRASDVLLNEIARLKTQLRAAEHERQAARTYLDYVDTYTAPERMSDDERALFDAAWDARTGETATYPATMQQAQRIVYTADALCIAMRDVETAQTSRQDTAARLAADRHWRALRGLMEERAIQKVREDAAGT